MFLRAEGRSRRCVLGAAALRSGAGGMAGRLPSLETRVQELRVGTDWPVATRACTSSAVVSPTGQLISLFRSSQLFVFCFAHRLNQFEFSGLWTNTSHRHSGSCNVSCSMYCGISCKWENSELMFVLIIFLSSVSVSFGAEDSWGSKKDSKFSPSWTS